ncbi:restriction endonuclease subunit S [Staphylococcus simulans]|nr:restriction endonuclease subunit S [Staphylococcus simulans]
MTNEMRNVPELRFPEFDGEWEEKKLGDIADFTKGKLLGKKDLIDEGKYPCILYGELYTKYGSIINDVVSRTNVNKDKLKKGSKNQILIPSSGETIEDIATASTLNTNKDVYIGGDLNILTPKEQDGKFISLSLNGINKWNMAKLAQGKTVVHLYNNDIKTLNINLPHKMQEQQKIGEFFSKLDRQIELEEQKLAKLEEQKKGYMQKIFSQELRFKDENGNDYPEWKEEKLNNVLEKIIDNRGKTPENNATEIYPILEVNSLGNYYPKYKKVVKFVSEETYKTWFREHLKVNDVLFSTVGNTGIVSLMDNNKAVIAQNIVGLRLNYENEAAFLYYLLSYWENQKKVKQIQMGAVQPSVKVSQFKYLKFFFPVKDEQRKISVFLTKFDKVFENQSNKIEILKERKKGFLQKMFV